MGSLAVHYGKSGEVLSLREGGVRGDRAIKLSWFTEARIVEIPTESKMGGKLAGITSQDTSEILGNPGGPG